MGWDVLNNARLQNGHKRKYKTSDVNMLTLVESPQWNYLMEYTILIDYFYILFSELCIRALHDLSSVARRSWISM